MAKKKIDQPAEQVKHRLAVYRGMRRFADNLDEWKRIAGAFRELAAALHENADLLEMHDGGVAFNSVKAEQDRIQNALRSVTNTIRRDAGRLLASLPGLSRESNDAISSLRCRAVAARRIAVEIERDIGHVRPSHNTNLHDVAEHELILAVRDNEVVARTLGKKKDTVRKMRERAEDRRYADETRTLKTDVEEMRRDDPDSERTRRCSEALKIREDLASLSRSEIQRRLKAARLTTDGKPITKR